MSALAIPEGVEELQLNFATATSLAGIPSLPKLRHLEIHYARKLTSIAEIARFAPALEHLVVAKCPHVADGPAVMRDLPRLQHGSVQGVLNTDAPT